MTSCSQCGRNAFSAVGQKQIPLCLDCWHKFQATLSMQQAEYARQINFLLSQAEAVTGMYGLHPRFEVPTPQTVLRSENMAFNNINVENSVVGAINTGQVENIDVALTNIRLGGNEALAEALAEFTEALLKSAELADKAKADVIAQVSFLADQVRTPQKQPTVVVKNVMEGVRNAVTTATSLVALWDKLAPLLANALGA